MREIGAVGFILPSKVSLASYYNTMENMVITMALNLDV